MRMVCFTWPSVPLDTSNGDMAVSWPLNWGKYVIGGLLEMA